MEKTIFLVGLNHRSAGVDVREKFALTSVADFEKSLLAACPLREVMALSTCNRVEILVVADTDRCAGIDLAEAVLRHWAETCAGPLDALREHTYRHTGLDAVTHLFCVAASLDSMIMGEPQILGQLKTSYRKAVETGTARVIINRLLHKSFSVAKRVRTETAIASSAVSISYAAVELAKKIFGELAGKTALLVGAGEMAELAATHLLASGIEKLYITNRTYSRAQELAKTMHGEAVLFEALVEQLRDVDIVISSTGSPTAIIRAKDIREVLKKRRNRAMFFIDIAVPRDIDPDVNALDNVYLYDIDDLKEVVEENMSARQGEAVKARAIVDVETQAFATWLKSLALQPTITDLLGRAERRASVGPWRLRLVLAQMSLLGRAGHWPVAVSLAEAAAGEVERRGLEDWDPDLALEALLAAREAYAGLGGEVGLAKAREYAACAARIRPSAALHLTG